MECKRCVYWSHVSRYFGPIVRVRIKQEIKEYRPCCLQLPTGQVDFYTGEDDGCDLGKRQGGSDD